MGRVNDGRRHSGLLWYQSSGSRRSSSKLKCETRITSFHLSTHYDAPGLFKRSSLPHLLLQSADCKRHTFMELFSSNSPSPQTCDEARIRWLVETYCFAIDANDDELLCSCVADDVTIVYHAGEKHEVRLAGKFELVEYLRRGPAWNCPSIHALSTCVVSITGESTAVASAFAIAHLVNNGRILVRGLRYDDVLTSIAGRWVFQHRTHRAIWQYDADSMPSRLPGR